MKKEIRLLLQEAFGQTWRNIGHWKDGTEFHNVEDVESAVKQADLLPIPHIVDDIIAVGIEYVKTTVNNLVPEPKVTNVWVKSSASYVEVLQAIGHAQKEEWYSYVTGPLYQVGYSWKIRK